MNLPNLSNVEIPKRIAAAIAGMYFIKEIDDIYMAIILASILVAGIAAQTITDIVGKKAI